MDGYQINHKRQIEPKTIHTVEFCVIEHLSLLNLFEYCHYLMFVDQICKLIYALFWAKQISDAVLQ